MPASGSERLADEQHQLHKLFRIQDDRSMMVTIACKQFLSQRGKNKKFVATPDGAKHLRPGSRQDGQVPRALPVKEAITCMHTEGAHRMCIPARPAFIVQQTDAGLVQHSTTAFTSKGLMLVSQMP